MENTNEVFKKEYATKELRQKIENQINNKYEEFSDIIVDITLKRAYTFGFSEEEILKDVDSLLKNCDKIKLFKNNYYKKIEEQQREKYNPNNLFENRKQEVTDKTQLIANEVAMVEYKESIFKRFINKIKNIFHLQ